MIQHQAPLLAFGEKHLAAAGIQPHEERDVDKLDFVTISRRVRAQRGKWRLFSKETEAQMRAGLADRGEE